jgi:hypothetical protein
VVPLGHLDPALQAKLRSRLFWEDVTKGRNGTATAQPASMAMAAAAAANFMMFRCADVPDSECNI